MIYGITGLPGNGKTLYAISWLLEKAKAENRPVWYHNINGLKIDGWNKVPTYTQDINGVAVEVPKWWEAPTNSYVIIDEAQNCGFGDRARGQVPEWARKLETHRHLGIDLVFITQSPMLLAAHDRALIGTHFHVVRNFGMARATIHEFQQLRENVLKSRTGSIRHEWRYPKGNYALYTSAETHTHKARIPARVWLLIALPFVLGGIIWFMADRWTAKIKGTDIQAPGGVLPGRNPGAPAPSRTGPAGPGGERHPVLTRAEYLAQFTPRLEGFAYTAPVYDEITRPVEAPYPAACIASKARCQCYTQQGTHLEVPEALCRQVSAGGFFIAWQHGAGAAPIARSEGSGGGGPLQGRREASSGAGGAVGGVGSLGGSPRGPR